MKVQHRRCGKCGAVSFCLWDEARQEGGETLLLAWLRSVLVKSKMLGDTATSMCDLTLEISISHPSEGDFWCLVGLSWKIVVHGQ